MLGRSGLACVLVALAAATAHADDTLTAVIVADPASAEILSRVEGQVSDLDVDLVIAHEAPALTPDRDDARARDLASRHDARVVVWFRADGDAWIVHVAEPATGTRLVRRVTAGGELATSAAAESAALVVRSALRALADGGVIGIDEPAPEPTPRPEVRAPAAPSRAPPRRPYAEVGWRGVVDGATSAGHHGVAVRLGGAAGRWRVAAAAELMPAVSHVSPLATIDVERAAFGAAIGIDLVGAATAGAPPRWRITAELAVAASRYDRVTRMTATSLEPTPGTQTWAGVVSPTAQLARRVSAGVWLTVHVGADVVAGAPEFAVETTSGPITHTSLLPVQPRAGVGVVVDMF